jgi:NADH:ubiquinone reductase (H+-translocating)
VRQKARSDDTPRAAAAGGGPGAPRRHVVVVGAGFGGLEVAKTLGGKPAVRVTLIDRRNYHLFVPFLYQVATATLSPADVARPIRSILSRYANVEVLLGEVTGVDTAARRVLMGGHAAVGYDDLVIATGSGQSYFGHGEWARHAPGLKTIEDAREIRGRLPMAFERAEMADDPGERRRLMTVVLVGGGPTGVEMAGAVAELVRQTLRREFRHIRPDSARIILLEALPRLLTPFPEALAEFAKRRLERRGVELRLGTPVEGVDEEGVTAGGERIPAGTVIWTAGVAASPAGRWLGVETDKAGRVKVDEHLRVPGLADVYVIGDTALALDEGGQPLPGLAQVAKQQGRHLGRALARKAAGQPWPGPLRFRNYGNMAVIGRNAAVADFGWWRTGGFGAWLLWLLVHIYLLIGFRNKLVVTIEWLWVYLTHQRGARLITGERKAPLEGEPGVGA